MVQYRKITGIVDFDFFEILAAFVNMGSVSKNLLLDEILDNHEKNRNISNFFKNG